MQTQSKIFSQVVEQIRNHSLSWVDLYELTMYTLSASLLVGANRLGLHAYLHG